MRRKALALEKSEKLSKFLKNSFDLACYSELSSAVKALKEERFEGVFLSAEDEDIEHTIGIFFRRNPLLTFVLFSKTPEEISSNIENLVDLVAQFPPDDQEIERINSLFMKKDILNECELV
ncbi:MAG: hypothetical protein ACPL6C_01010, partial [bacterium]